MMIRKHHFVKSIHTEGCIDVSDYPDMQELLYAADSFITGLFVNNLDYSLTYKPGFLFVPDLDEYTKDRSFYTDPETWAFPLARTNEELVELIKTYDTEESRKKIDQHHEHLQIKETGKATEHIVEKIIKITEGKSKMDNFYDVNDFFAYVLRKWKSFIGIIIVIALVYGGVRGINLLQEYRNQPKEEENVTEENKDGDEPIWSRVLININIEPVYKEVDGNTIDTTEQIIEAYRKLGSSEKVMNHMYDTWFEKAAKEAEARKTKLHDYGYILDKELKNRMQKLIL